MLRTVFVWVLLASAQANRIQLHEASQAQTKWGTSCDDLQSRFHDRVTAIQASLEGIDEQSDLSAAARTRLGMRMYGIIRTLRRARECSWVIENNSEDLDQMRGVVQLLLAGNQCAEAARLEMERGRSDENAESMTRAVGILMSDDCEVPETPEGANTEMTPEEQLQETEDEIQDRFDEVDTNGEGSAFIEADKSQTFRGFMRGVGVFFLMLFLLLACTAAAAAIAFALTWGLMILSIIIWGRTAVVGRDGWGALGYLVIGTGGGAVLGLPSCAYQLYTNLLPRVTQ